MKTRSSRRALIHAQQQFGAKAGLQARARLARQLRDAFDANIAQALDCRGRQPQRPHRQAAEPFGRPAGCYDFFLAVTRDRPGTARRVGDRHPRRDF
jgi:hypothetical protein